jgi:hypothetical protein
MSQSRPGGEHGSRTDSGCGATGRRSAPAACHTTVPYRRSGSSCRTVVCTTAAKKAGTAKDHPPADLHHLPRLMADLDDPRVAKMLGSDESGLRLAPHLPSSAWLQACTLCQGRVGRRPLRSSGSGVSRSWIAVCEGTASRERSSKAAR